MADIIFTSSSCAKKDIYATLINTMINAGWQNVSSNPATDFDVLSSTGVNGDKNLVIQLRKTSASNTNAVDTTDYCEMSYRLVASYTPGASSVSGTFGRPSLGWNKLYIAPSTSAVAKDTVCNYKVFADKNRIIMAIEYPPASNLKPVLFYIGIPDSTYCSESGSRGLLVAASYNANVAGAEVTNTPDGLSSLTSSETLSVYTTLAPTNPNNSGKYVLSEIFYGSSNEGIRFKLDGVLALPTTNVLNGDIIQIGTQQYYVLTCASYGNTAFPSSNTLAIRVA